MALLKAVINFAIERIDIIYNRIKIVGEYTAATCAVLGCNAGLVMVLGDIHSSYQDIQSNLDDVVESMQSIKDSNEINKQERKHIIDEFQNLNNLLKNSKDIISGKTGEYNE